MFWGLRGWVDAGWVGEDIEEEGLGEVKRETEEALKGKSGESEQKGRAEQQGVKHQVAAKPATHWTRRPRPVLPALALMGVTHALGGMVFYIVTRRWFIANIESIVRVFFSTFSSFSF